MSLLATIKAATTLAQTARAEAKIKAAAKAATPKIFTRNEMTDKETCVYYPPVGEGLTLEVRKLIGPFVQLTLTDAVKGIRVLRYAKLDSRFINIIGAYDACQYDKLVSNMRDEIWDVYNGKSVVVETKEISAEEVPLHIRDRVEDKDDGTVF